MAHNKKAFRNQTKGVDHHGPTPRLLEGLKVFEIKRICYSMKIDRLSTLRKYELIALVNIALSTLGKPFVDEEHDIMVYPHVFLNDHDPITQESLVNRKPEHLFTIRCIQSGPKDTKRNISHVHRFDPISMVEMLVTSGKAVNPISQQPMSSEDLQRLEYAYFNCLRCFPSSPSCISSFLMKRKDIKKRMISGKNDTSILNLEDTIVDLPRYNPWENSEKIAVVALRAMQEEKQLQEWQAQTDYFIYYFERQLENLLKMVRIIPEDVSSITQANYSEVVFHHFVPALYESLLDVFRWDSTSGVACLCHIVDATPLGPSGDNSCYATNIMQYTAVACAEKLNRELLNRPISANDDESKRVISTILETFSSRELLCVSIDNIQNSQHIS
jgi:hypothetical protein